MKKFDFAIQSMVFITAIVFLITSLFQNDVLSCLALVQLFLGGWQLLSWLISILIIGQAKASIKNHFAIYTMTVFAYFIIWFAGSQMELDRQLVNAFIFGPPWLIGIYYYFITYQFVITKKNREHSFLDLN